MIYKKDTEIGEILVEKNVIVELVYEAVAEFGKKVVVGNYSKNTDKLYQKMSTGAENSAIQVTIGENGPDIKICVMVKFGTSIGQVSKKLIMAVRQGVYTTLGVEPGRVEVVITGIISKNVVRRNIKITEKKVKNET